MKKIMLGVCLGGLLASVVPVFAMEDMSGSSTMGGPATKHHSMKMMKHHSMKHRKHHMMTNDKMMMNNEKM